MKPRLVGTDGASRSKWNEHLIPAGTGLREYTRQVVMTNDEHEAALAAKAAEELVPTKRPSRAGKREASVSAE